MTEADIDRICEYINKGYKVMVVLRGLPGSGKSTLANTIIKRTFPTYNSNMFVFSADNFFLNIGYQSHLVGEAHDWNQRRAFEQAEEGLSPIIIDNTNLELWEMKPYVQRGVKLGYIIEVLDIKTMWARKVNKLANTNIHDVPKDKIMRMLEKYRTNWDVNSKQLVENVYKLKYPKGFEPPCMRARPAVSIEGYYSNNGNKRFYKKRDNSNPTTPLENYNPKTDPPPRNNFSNIQIHQPDLIDFRDAPNVMQNSVNFINFTNNFAAATSLQGKVDSTRELWTESWTKEENQTKKINIEPKPQRSGKNNTLSATGINWEPIAVTMSFWDHPNKQTTDNSTTIVNKMKCDASTSMQGSGNESYREMVCNTQSRDINPNYLPSTSKIVTSVPKLDKGIMASEDDIIQLEDDQKNQAFKEFSAVFGGVPKETIKDLLHKCKGDVNWAGELLLDAKNESGFVVLNTTDDQNGAAPADDDDTYQFYPEDVEESASCPETCDKNVEVAKVNKHSKKTQSESALQLKKEIEQNFKYDDNMYSKNNLKVKRRLHGEPDDTVDLTDNPESKTETAINDVAGPSGINTNGCNSNSSNVRETEKTVQFNLGCEFIQQLDKFYGTCYTSDETLEPVVNMPMSLVNQIHALWLESICNQKEVTHTMMLEDEEFVRQVELLEQQQATQGTRQNVSNLQEILDMEMALACYHADLTQWKSENQEDLATKLTRQKLIEMFPEINKDVLLEIYKAHDNNFEQTLQGVLLSTGKISEYQTQDADKTAIRKMMEQQEQILLEKAKKEKEMVRESKVGSIQNFVICTNVDVPDSGNLTSLVQYFREEAKLHLQMRSRHQNKAKEYVSVGNAQAASYYYHMASLYSQKYDHSNNLAISGLMQLGSDKNNYTLDLHHLYVYEALQVLDIFIDKHIADLRDSNSKDYIQSSNVFIITGRGRHSPQNKPRIKPAVIKRLKDRGLPMQEVNPGLLGVNLSSLNMLSADIQHP